MKELYYKMVSFWRHWRYCNGCKYLCSFKCAKHEQEEPMVYGCCCHTRGPKKSNVKSKKFEDKMSVSWHCRKCDTIIMISEHWVSDPCPGCGWIWKGKYCEKEHNVEGVLVKKMKLKYAHDAYDHTGDKL